MHEETHAVTRIGWLRAAILGANDGIVSTASLIAGVAAAGAAQSSILMTGTAGLVAGAMSMAAGEYVSVSSQGDAEKSDIELEKRHLAADPEFELEELTQIYQQRGLDRALAEQVAVQLTAHDALDTHLRDELGLTDAMAARPGQAAAASAASFAIGAVLPLATVLLDSGDSLPWTVSTASLVFLALLGALGARAGNAPILRPVVRVTFWGAAAMAVTIAIGSLFHTAIG
ncbi:MULTISPECIES: VIT family protein [unclassified Sphingopyxis]|uniref:VIT1/CCC1 transporter family protein n=1 Tax=unclassified Sphingopyxis TaxID=2614943 RepID=UPI0028644D6A|nr:MULTISPECIES: VIT family protein [unclassified Sphingopyxis]MDR6832827.1 VIT1/CCC1 family predicted Fe2+/Mn2+ transporter [Sphingopyxis sp. BE122]MDR7228570.1 VIT1/CCC1 family predicted Fe2+/Mn2+ transporter [Sphingopyxis sp. BE259]